MSMFSSKEQLCPCLNKRPILTTTFVPHFSTSHSFQLLTVAGMTGIPDGSRPKSGAVRGAEGPGSCSVTR